MKQDYSRCCRCRAPAFGEQLLKAENHPLRQIALKNDLAMVRHYDRQIFQLEEELQRQTKRVAGYIFGKAPHP